MIRNLANYFDVGVSVLAVNPRVAVCRLFRSTASRRGLSKTLTGTGKHAIRPAGDLYGSQRRIWWASTIVTTQPGPGSACNRSSLDRYLASTTWHRPPPVAASQCWLLPSCSARPLRSTFRDRSAWGDSRRIQQPGTCPDRSSWHARLEQ